MNKVLFVGILMLVAGVAIAISQSPTSVSTVNGRDIIVGAEALPLLVVFFGGMAIFAFAIGLFLNPEKGR